MKKLLKPDTFFARRFLSVFLLTVILSGHVFSQVASPARATLSTEEQSLASAITVQGIKDTTVALTADEMEGRGTMQIGGDKAANWIAERFKQLGLKPLGDKDSFLQRIEFREIVSTEETSFSVGDETLVLGKDYGFLPMNNGT